MHLIGKTGFIRFLKPMYIKLLLIVNALNVRDLLTIFAYAVW